MTKQENRIVEFEPTVEIDGGDSYRKALEVQDFVYQTLTYQQKSDLDRLDLPESVRRTNCIGFSLVGSEWLEHAGVEHYLAVANGHATTLVVDESNQGTNIWLMDMLSPRLNQKLSGVISPEDLEETEHKPGEPPARSVLAIYGDRIASHASYPKDLGLDAIYMRHPWLLVNNSTSNPKTKLVWSIYHPDAAKEVFPAYAKFHDATVNEKPDDYDLDSAADAVIELGGSFPDVDIRGDSPKTVKTIVKKLAIAGDVERAEAVIKSFYSSFGFSKDTRVAEYQADCLRAVAKFSGASGYIRRRFLNQALDLYTGIARRPYVSTSVVGKIAACNSLESNLVVE